MNGRQDTDALPAAVLGGARLGRSSFGDRSCLGIGGGGLGGGVGGVRVPKLGPEGWPSSYSWRKGVHPRSSQLAAGKFSSGETRLNPKL